MQAEIVLSYIKLLTVAPNLSRLNTLKLTKRDTYIHIYVHKYKHTYIVRKYIHTYIQSVWGGVSVVRDVLEEI
jgi:hypothetical protein